MSPFNNSLSTEEIVVRPTTPIFNNRFWQEVIITTGETASCTSVAVRRMELFPDKVFVAYIAGGTLTVKSAIITSPIQNMVWTVEEIIVNCSSCALEFDGSFVKSRSVVDFFTNSTPWLFYTTTSGELWAGIIGGSFEILVASGVTTIDVVRGVANFYKDIDQGLIVFYILNNAVYYRQLIANVWQGQQQVNLAPANPASIKVERLFDYRICLHVTDVSGALWEVFTKMEASGWNGTEYISASLSTQSALISIGYSDYQSAHEYIEASLSVVSTRLYCLSPVFIEAVNINNGSDNYGVKVSLQFDENVFGYETNYLRFMLEDGYGGAWCAIAATKTDYTLAITFIDFNNSSGPLMLSYTPGTMMGDIVALAADTIQFEATGLVTWEEVHPAVVSVEGIDAKTICITFDIDVNSCSFVDLLQAFVVSGHEYDMIPEGSLQDIVYAIDTIAYDGNDNTKLLVTLTDVGRMKYPSGDVNIVYNKGRGNLLGDANGQVDSLSQAFTPTSIVPVFNPNDVEYINASLSIASNLMQIYYEDYKSSDEYISVALSVTSQIIAVADLQQ